MTADWTITQSEGRDAYTFTVTMSVVVVSRFTVPNVGYFGKHPTWRWPAQWGGEGWPCFVVSADTRCQERLGGIHCSKPAGHEGGHFSDTMHFGWSG